MLKPKYKLSGRPVFAFSLPWGQFASLSPVSYVIRYDIVWLHIVNRDGLTIGQTGQMPVASKFWGPRPWISKDSFPSFSYF